MGNRKDRKKKDKKKALKHRFAKKESPTDTPSDAPLIFFEPRGEEKMSEVLLDFIRPYEDSWKTEDHLKKLLAVALVAWNAAIEAGPRGEELIQSTMATLPPDAQADFLAIVVDLVERKLKYFAGNRRLIVDYKLTMTEDGNPHLSVMSTLDIPR